MLFALGFPGPSQPLNEKMAARAIHDERVLAYGVRGGASSDFVRFRKNFTKITFFPTFEGDRA